VVSSYIYLEGGGESKDLKMRCQRAFHQLLDRMGFTGRKPRLVACGSRQESFDRFRTAHEASGRNFVALWVDSEEPMRDVESAWSHLANVTTVTAWRKPTGVTEDQVLLMTTCMETWIVADQVALREFFGQHLMANRLPALTNLEQVSRNSIQDALKRATCNCSNAFTKGKRSFEVFGAIDPETLNEHLPSFARVWRILQQKL
jgi:Domain of unknown function (DUF4276)